MSVRIVRKDTASKACSHYRWTRCYSLVFVLMMSHLGWPFILNFHIHFHRRSWCASWSFLTLFICDIHLHLNPPHSSSIIIFIKYFFIIFKVDRHLRLLSSIFIVIRISHCHIQCSSSALIFLSDLHVRLSSWIFSFILTFIWDLHLQFHLHLRYQSSISILDLRHHVYTHL